MISFLRGRLAGTTGDTVLLDVGGIGFGVTVAPSARAKLPAVGEEIVIYTHLLQRESGVELYGFLDEAERAAFLRLLTVGGIGPRSALALVGSLGVGGLWEAIRREDVGRLTGVPGVGKKLASRLVLELKETAGREVGTPPPGREDDEALEALLALGYGRSEALAALAGAPEDAEVAVRLKAALQWLGQGGRKRQAGVSK
ncbi:MAG: Holliday junction branch migration protein RuvA [Bacillota bacterium]